MIAESPVKPSRNAPQTSRPDQEQGSYALRQPSPDGDYPTDDMEMPVSPRDVTSADRAPSRQEYPEFDTDREEAFWEATHQDQPYAGEDDHARFAPAYRIGYEGYQRLGAEYTFDDVEEDLQEEYEGEGSSLPWERAREATRAAWNRLEGRKEDAENEAGVPVP